MIDTIKSRMKACVERLPTAGIHLLALVILRNGFRGLEGSLTQFSTTITVKTSRFLRPTRDSGSSRHLRRHITQLPHRLACSG